MKTKLNAPALDNRLIEFAAKIVKLADSISKINSTKYLSNQILRSGTAPALNYGEAQEAESAADFIHKMKICLKELRETFNCLKIIDLVLEEKQNELDLLKKENNELISIFVASVKTARRNKEK